MHKADKKTSLFAMIMYTLNPVFVIFRYPNLNPAFFKPHQVKRQYDGQDLAYLNQIVQIADLQSSRYGQNYIFI